MIWVWGHPDFEELSRYAHEELAGGRRARVAAHLTACGRCRGGLRFVRELRDAARELAVPDAKDRGEALLGRILTRRANGERVILPLTGPIPLEPRPVHRLRPVAAILAPLVVIAALVVGVPHLRANRSQLEFSPARPEAGEWLRVTYRSGSLLDDEDRVILRAVYRTPDGDRRPLHAGALVRVGDRTFQGTVKLPDSTAYAAFVVEDAAGLRVDSNLHRFWEILVHDEHGLPRFEALAQRLHEHVGRDWEAAHQAALRMTALYPERIEGWEYLYSVERTLVGNAGLDSLDAENLDRLRALERRADASALPVSEIGALTFYALVLGDSVRYRRWLDRLISVAPNHRYVGLSRMLEARGAHGREDARRTLARYDSIWNDVEDARRIIVGAGLATARKTGDPAAVVRWADRHALAIPASASHMAIGLAAQPGSRTAGMRRIRAHIDRLESPIGPDRPLGVTAAEEERRRRIEASHLLAALGRALVAEGRVRAGVDTVRLAAARGWDPVVYRAAADALRVAGDTTSSLAYLAALAVDPVLDEAERDSLTALVRRRVGEQRFSVWTARARREMRDHYLGVATRRPVHGDATLTDTAGRHHTLESILDGHVALIGVVSGYDGPDVAGLPQLRELGGRIARLGGRVAIVTLHDPVAALRRRLAEERIAFPVVTDAHGDARRNFRNRGVPAYFVVDADGLIRFENMSLEDAVRQAVILLTDEEPVMPSIAAPDP